MATYRIGEKDLDLEIVGAGLQNGALRSVPALERAAAEPPTLEVKFGAGGRKDLDAFRAAGWEFQPGEDLHWSDVQNRNAEKEISPGLLARSPTEGLVIIRDRLVVQFRSGIDSERLARRLASYAQARSLGFCDNLFEVRLRLPDRDLQGAIRRELELLAASDEVEFAEPSLLYHVLPPNPPTEAGPFEKGDSDRQWQWKNIGLYEAWKQGKVQGEGTLVAVIDVGFHAEDPEIEPNVALKASFTQEGDLVLNEVPLGFHGTFCAGLIGARVDGDGVNGAAPKCKLMLVAMPRHGVLSQVALGKALEFCADRGADVISCSLGPAEKNWELSTALRRAIDCVHARGRLRGGKHLGVPVVWAVFNADEEINANSVNGYPPVLSVSQCDRTGERVDSGWGQGLDLLAPGYGVLGILWSGKKRQIWSGTGSSYAAPCVAGVAALVLAANRELDWSQVAEVLTRSCDPPSSEKSPSAKEGWGRLNASRAVEMALSFP